MCHPKEAVFHSIGRAKGFRFGQCVCGACGGNVEWCSCVGKWIGVTVWEVVRN